MLQILFNKYHFNEEHKDKELTSLLYISLDNAGF